MAVIGCDIPVQDVVGTEILSEPGMKSVWVKTHFSEKNGFLVAQTYLVAAGEPLAFELRIDLKPLLKVAELVHRRMHEKMAAEHAKVSGTPMIGFSFSKAWKGIKKTAKKIGKSKLLKAVGHAVKVVVKSKFVGALAAGLAIAVPVVGLPALAAYGAAKVAVGAVDAGKKLVHTAAKLNTTVKTGAAAVKTVASVKAAASAHARTNVAAAKKIAVAVKAKPTPPAVKAKAAAQAKAHVASAKTAAVHAKAVQAKAAPLVKAAAATQNRLADPKVRAHLLSIKNKASSAAKVFADIQTKAKFGTPEEKLDAQKNKAIVNLTAQNEARIKAIAQANAGGLPAMLINKKGQIIRGRFRISTTAPGKNPDVLYQGPGQQHQAGQFAKIAGTPRSARSLSPYPSLSPEERSAKERAWKEWLAVQKGERAPSRPRSTPPPRRSRRPSIGHQIGCYPMPKTGPMPKVAGTLSIGCDCEGSQF